MLLSRMEGDFLKQQFEGLLTFFISLFMPQKTHILENRMMTKGLYHSLQKYLTRMLLPFLTSLTNLFLAHKYAKK